jgi:hypothetical protein
MFGERQIQTLLGPADPARGVTVPPAPCSAADLIRSAEADARVLPVPVTRSARASRRLVLAGASLVLAAGVTATVAVRRAGPGTGGPPLGPVLVPIAYQYETNPPAAGDRLRALADRIGATGYDADSGRYAYHHYKTWGATVATSTEGYEIHYVEDEQTWIAADGSGRIRTAQLAPEFPDDASRRYWQRKLSDAQPAKTPASRSDDLPAGMAGPGGPLTLTADRAQLSQKLHLDVADAVGVAKTVSDKYQTYLVPRAARAQILRILADVPGLVWRGRVTDRAGRAGVAISADDPAHDVQLVLIFNAATGELYAQEMNLLREHKVMEYALFLRSGYADRLG